MSGRYAGTAALIERIARVLLYTNTSRYCPTYKTLARGLDISERQARRYLDAIEAAGWPMPPRRPEEPS